MSYLEDISRALVSKESITTLLIIDKDFKIVLFNDSIHKVIGDTSIENGDSFYKLLDFYGEKINDAIKRSFNGISSEVEHKSTTDDSFFESIVRPLKDESSVIYGVYITSKDITKRIRHLTTLEHNEKELKALYDNAPLGYQSLDKNGRFLYVNDTLSNMLEYPKEELIGEWFGDFLSNQGSPMFKKNFPKFKGKGETRVNIEMQTKSGNEIKVMFDGKIAYKDDGSFKQTHCILKDITEEVKKQQEIDALAEQLKETHMLLKSSLDSFKDIITWSIDNNYCYLYFNDSFKQAMKVLYKKDIKVGDNLLDLINVFADREKAKGNHELSLSGKAHTVIEEYGDEHKMFFETSFSPIRNSENIIIGSTGFSRDITERVKSTQKLRDSEEKLRNTQTLLKASIDSQTYIPIFSLDTNFRYLLFNKAHAAGMKELYGESIEVGKCIFDYMSSIEDIKNVKENYMLTLSGVSHKKTQEYGDIHKHFYEAYYSPIFDDLGKVIGISVFTEDVTDRIKRENDIRYLSFHDSLTGLYNRRFFEEEMKRLDNPRNYPITVVMGDVNGLKLVNDAFGHTEGDNLLKEVGTLLQEGCRGNDVVCRWGGDEFVLLLPKTSNEEAKCLMERITNKTTEACCTNVPVNISVSYGYETKVDDSQNLNDVFLQAEQLMYINKIDMDNSVRTETIGIILNTLFEKSSEVKLHTERVSMFAEQIAIDMGLSKTKVSEIKTMGNIHDIGKIVIDLSILDKPGKLTVEEYEIIKLHPVSGARMLASSHEYNKLSPGVLHHHERIDGKGYPHGLSGEEIPLESRIISVADAYDAMRSDRLYRETLTKKEAIEELIKHSGTQFDEKIVDVFVNSVLKRIG